MKKYLLFFIVCFAFNTLLFAELTKAQMWAISLTGIMTEINNSNRNSLSASTMDEKGKNSWLTVLSRDWGITTREELLETLDRTENSGHAAPFREIQEIIREISSAKDEFEMTAVLMKYSWDQTKFNRFSYVMANWAQHYNRTIKAWDLGRNISLCRWGYNVGFITEDEAWKKIFYYANLIQSLYNSWEEYGYDYFMGRIFWASGFGEEKAYFTRTEPIYKKLMNSYWGWLEWHIDLEQAETTIPVNTIRFLMTNNNDGTMQFSTNDPALYNRAPIHYFVNPNPNPNIFECRVKKISGNDDYGYGILFCVDDTDSNNISYYRFFITVNGRYTIQKRVGDIWATAPLGWTDSSSINTGFNAYNTLRVERTDNENDAAFKVFINGTLSGIFNDSKPINGNKIGLVVSVNVMELEQFPYIPVDVRFNF
jgi:hypothetical protein